ncbi:MAG TPA: hypothetical protein VFT12_07005 [Thermoanaerobaculia bacterium]|nr:hypothetical protein [Thermoanaerobaculia bacterium]
MPPLSDAAAESGGKPPHSEKLFNSEQAEQRSPRAREDVAARRDRLAGVLCLFENLIRFFDTHHSSLSDIAVTAAA